MRFLLGPTALAIAALIAGSDAAKPAPAAMETSVMPKDPPLVLSLSTNQSELALDAPLTIEACLRNSSKEPVSVFGRLLWGLTGGLQLHVFDEAGGRVEPLSLDHDLPPPSWVLDAANYTRLYPGHAICVSRTDRLNTLVQRPGRYTLRLEYKSPAKTHPSGSADFFGRRETSLVSEPVQISVSSAEPQ